MIYSIKKGKHDFFPPEIPCLYRTPVGFSKTYKVEFYSSCVYDMKGDRDQADWNKGGGFSFNLFNNTQDAIMWSWRSNTKEIEIGAYWHIDGKKFSKYLSSTQRYAEITIKRHSDFWRVSSGGYSTDIKLADFTWAKKLGLWFGGENNEEGDFGGVAPNNMKIKI